MNVKDILKKVRELEWNEEVLNKKCFDYLQYHTWEKGDIEASLKYEKIEKEWQDAEEKLKEFLNTNIKLS